MNRRRFISGAVVGGISLTSGCISVNTVEHEFEMVSYEDIAEIYDIERSEIRSELPFVRQSDGNLIIESEIAYGSCSEPYVSDIYYTGDKEQVNVRVSTDSSLINIGGCTLSLLVSMYRIVIPKNDMNINSVYLTEKPDGESMRQNEIIV